MSISFHRKCINKKYLYLQFVNCILQSPNVCFDYPLLLIMYANNNALKCMKWLKPCTQNDRNILCFCFTINIKCNVSEYNRVPHVAYYDNESGQLPSRGRAHLEDLKAARPPVTQPITGVHVISKTYSCQ